MERIKTLAQAKEAAYELNIFLAKTDPLDGHGWRYPCDDLIALLREIEDEENGLFENGAL